MSGVGAREGAGGPEAMERALDRAFRRLARRPHARRELERDLERRGFPPEVVSTVLARCEALGYLDDRDFAASWARERIRLKPRARRRMVAELLRRGVSETEAEAGVERAFREAGITERELLERAAGKRWEARRTEDPSVLRRRLSAYLERRGFAFHEIREVVEGLVGRREGGSSD